MPRPIICRFRGLVTEPVVCKYPLATMNAIASHAQTAKGEHVIQPSFYKPIIAPMAWPMLSAAASISRSPRWA